MNYSPFKPRLLILSLVAMLISYGSLYPFNFTSAAPEALSNLFANWKLFTSRGDALGNIGLFVPWGIVGILAFQGRFGQMHAIGLTIFLGFVLALAVQVLQIWLPSRDAALADVFWNLVGTVGGLAVGEYYVLHHINNARQPPLKVVPASLLIAFIGTEWIPLVPSVNLQLALDQLKLLWGNPTLLPIIVFEQAAVAVLAGHLLAALIGTGSAKKMLPMMLVSVSFGKLFVHGVQLNFSGLLGFALGAVCWWSLAHASDPKRNAIVWIGLFTAYSFGALAPFSLRDEPAAISWIPFAAMLEGSMLRNVQSLSTSMLVFAGILYVVATNSGRCRLASFGLALWVLLFELLQTMIETRTCDLTEPFLVLALGQIFNALNLKKVKQSTLLASKDLSPTEKTPRQQKFLFSIELRTNQHNALRLVLQVVFIAILIAVGAALLLRQPAVPYNVKDLFRANGSVLSLLAFSLALVWAGGGAVWLSIHLSKARWPGLTLAPMTFIVSLISLTFLWAGVTTESIEDISGASNVFWWVTNRDTWGDGWRRTFLFLNTPGVIGFLEHCVRYSALYAPLPIFLSLMLVFRKRLLPASNSIGQRSFLIISALLLLWVCKAIAFDWTSTDNLNELIARDGAWRWGGGGYLYGLLFLFCISAMFLADAVDKGVLRLGLWVCINLGALPLGWWLLNQGLEQEVKKYNRVYSGTQFLLGPDRTNILSREILFFRWCIVQCASVLVLTVGLRLGQKLAIAFYRPNSG